MKKFSKLGAVLFALSGFLGNQAKADQLLWVGGGAYLTYGNYYYCHVVSMAQYNRIARRATQIGNRPYVPQKLTYVGDCRVL